jgi:hypothetical protein
MGMELTRIVGIRVILRMSIYIHEIKICCPSSIRWTEYNVQYTRSFAFPKVGLNTNHHRHLHFAVVVFVVVFG